MKVHKCKQCKSEYVKFQSTQKVCSPSCALELARSKVTKQKDAEHNKRKRKLKDDDRGFQLKKTQTLFNRFIRLRDDSEPCISCGRHHSGAYHAGHYRSVGGNSSSLRFEELNCHKQCAPCNNHLSGNLVDYRINLIKKIGLDEVEMLEGKHDPYKYGIKELKELQKHYSQIIKEMTNA